MKAKNILVPIDFSDASQRALEEADALAMSTGGSITLLHVYQMAQMVLLDFSYVEPPESVAKVCDAAEQELNTWAAKLSTPAERRSVKVTTGVPATELVEASKDYDLLVMSTHGRSGLSHFLLGSVAERVVQGAHCSVLVVKGQ